ncbi:hypothetical protein Tco_1430787 [Tanacetum coccineum]
MPLDCQLGIVAMWGKWEGFVKWLMECCRVEVWEQNRVLAGFGIGGKIGKSSFLKVKDFVMSDSEDSTVTYMEGPPSPNYVPGPEYPPSLVYVPYLPELVHPEFMPPEDDVLLTKEQPLPAAILPTTNLQGYITESDREEDPEEDDEDPKEDPADYPDDRDDGEEEEDSSRDDADDKEEDDDEDEEEEEEHLASADSVPPPGIYGHDESCCTTTYILTSRSETLPSGTPPLLPIPLLTPSTPLLLPSTNCRARVSEVTLLPRKRLYIALGLRFEVGESSSAPTARPTGGFRADYGFVGTLDDEIRQEPEREDTDEIYGRLDDAQDDRLLMSGQLNMLRRDRRAHARTARLIETEA